MDSASDCGSNNAYDLDRRRKYSRSSQRNRNFTRRQPNKRKWDGTSPKNFSKKSRRDPAAKTLRSNSFAFDSPQVDEGAETTQVKNYKPGRVTRYPFLNFLRIFRTQNSGKNILDVARAAGTAWRKMSKNEREPYYKQACLAPKRKINRRTKCPKCGYRGIKCKNNEVHKRTRSHHHRSRRHR